jgi:hypothetical protein
MMNPVMKAWIIPNVQQQEARREKAHRIAEMRAAGIYHSPPPSPVFVQTTLSPHTVTMKTHADEKATRIAEMKAAGTFPSPREAPTLVQSTLR